MLLVCLVSIVCRNIGSHEWSALCVGYMYFACIVRMEQSQHRSTYVVGMYVRMTCKHCVSTYVVSMYCSPDGQHTCKHTLVHPMVNICCPHICKHSVSQHRFTSGQHCVSTYVLRSIMSIYASAYM